VFTPGPIYPQNLLGRLMRLGSALAREPRPIDRIVSPIRRPLDRAWYRRAGRLGELGRLGESVAQVSTDSDGTRVLVLALRMWTHHVAYEAVIAEALRLRGAEVAVLICGGGQPICEVGWGRRVAPRPCDRCAYFTERAVRSGRLPLLRLADEFPWGPSPAQAPTRVGVPDGRAATTLASVAWFTKSAAPERTRDGAAVADDFAVSTAAVETAFTRVLDRYEPDVVFMLNGLFAAERTARDVATKRGVRVVTYEIAPRKDALVFGETAPAPLMLMDSLAEDQLSRPLSNRESEALEVLLRARVTGSTSHETYFATRQDHDPGAARLALGIPEGKRVVSAFTNLAWDTALFGTEIGYESQFEWLARTCETISSNKHVVLVIRTHPAESRWGTAQPVEQELRRLGGDLPGNVRLVGSADPLSSYALIGISDLVLGYTTTVGLEAAVRGIPVAVAAQTHYRGRGFTIDVESHADLERAIAELPPMTAEQIELARRYAFAFFFRRMIPFRHVRNVDGRLARVPEAAVELSAGQDPYLDFICERIIHGGEFHLPPELALLDQG